MSVEDADPNRDGSLLSRSGVHLVWCELTGWENVLNGVGNCLAALEQGPYVFAAAVTLFQNAPRSFAKGGLGKVSFVTETEVESGLHWQSDLAHVLWPSPYSRSRNKRQS